MAESDDTRRTHEVRIGMSLYWATTWQVPGGYAYSADGLEGTEPTRGDAVRVARERLREREASQLYVR